MDIWVIVVPLLRIALYVATFGALGTQLFIWHFGGDLSSTGHAYCRRLIANSSVVGVMICVCLWLAVAGNMSGTIAGIFDPVMLQLAFEASTGVAALLSLAGFILFFVGSAAKHLWHRLLPLIGSLLLLLSFSISGHVTRSGFITQLLLGLHLVGLAYWLGALLPLRKLCLEPNKTGLVEIAHRFGIYAFIYIGALVLSGATYAYLLLGSLSALVTTTYGNVLLAKIGTVSVLLLLGAINKFKLVPLLRHDMLEGAKKLYISIQWELIAVVIILFLTSLLTTSLNLPMAMMGG
ncbi:MAG: copper resistance D family protein [Pseudomonadales bacterium]